MYCPLWGWHSLKHRNEEGGKKDSLMKGRTPAPHLYSFLSPSLPCPVELIWQGSSNSQFTQAVAAFLVACLLSPVLPVHPPPCTSAFFVCALVCQCLCAQCLCHSASIGWWNNIVYSKVGESGTPEAGSNCLIQAVQLRYHHLPSPNLMCPPGVQSVTRTLPL